MVTCYHGTNCFPCYNNSNGRTSCTASFAWVLQQRICGKMLHTWDGHHMEPVALSLSFYILLTVPRRYFFCGSLMFCSVLCLVCLCARLFICALWSPAGKGLTSWLSFVMSTMSLSLSHWYPGSGVVLDCIDS